MPIFGGIFVGRRFGAFDSTPAGGRVDDAVGPAYPAAGTYAGTLYNQEYPVAEGGGYFLSPVDNETEVANQTATVDEKHDGSGGTYIDWSTVSDVTFKAYGNVFYTTGVSPIFLNINGADYANGSNYDEYVHDGSGSWTTIGHPSYPSADGLIFNDGIPVDDPGFWFPSPIDSEQIIYKEYYGTNYFYDGNGSYYTGLPESSSYKTNGTYFGTAYSTTEVPSGSYVQYENGIYSEYYHDGSGSYYSVGGGSYAESGVFITQDGSYDYFWDGNGGYYSQPVSGGGDNPAYGTLLNSTYDGEAVTYITEESVNAPSGSIYSNEYADGNGGSYFENVTTWVGAGTQIYQANGFEYIADGLGGYSQLSCSLYGTFISSGSSSIQVYVTEVGSYVQVGDDYYDVLADGNCGTFTSSTGSSYASYGALLTSWDDGVGNYYAAYSDGYGGYYVDYFNP